MRFYSFTNMYLSSLQIGLQSAHVNADMFVKYRCTGDPKHTLLWEWAEQHKTMILLNGGYSETLRDLITFFDHVDNPYPWGAFHESPDALDGALTSVGIVISEKIYTTAAYIRTLSFKDKESVLSTITYTGRFAVPSVEDCVMPTQWEYNKWEYQFIQRLNGFGLAK